MGIGFKIARGMMDALGALPLSVHYRFGGALSFLLHHVLHYREKVVRTNIARSFPRMTYKEVDQTVDKFYGHLGDLVAETIWFGGCHDYSRIEKQKIVRVEGFEQVEEVFAQGRSVMALFSHAGNWELIGGLFGYLGRESELNLDNCKVVYKNMTSGVWNEVFKANRVAPHGATQCMLESARVLRYAIAHKDERLGYVFPTDQYPYRSAKAHKVKDFLHQRTVAMTGGAALAGKLNMGVFFLGMPVESRGHYIFTFEKICDDASTMTPGQIMDIYYEKLQRQIEAQPWNYLWTHKRWKNRPEDFEPDENDQ